MKSSRVPSTIGSDIMTGYVHSIESFGTVDGPGIRYVVFLQGCPMRCAYCHNPDTWKAGQGHEMTPVEVLAGYNKNRAFYTKGGLTVTGGEPLMQPAFVKELLTLAKSRGIHTALDTSGIMFSGPDPLLDDILEQTDLVLLDIKHMDSAKHKALTARDNRRVLAFARYLDEKRIPMWIRHTVVPGYTDDPADLKELGRFIGTLRYAKALDILPYHTLGVSKYQELGMDYPLDGVPPLDKAAAAQAKQTVLEGIREIRASATSHT